jgi:hypothetical protein
LAERISAKNKIEKNNPMSEGDHGDTEWVRDGIIDLGSMGFSSKTYGGKAALSGQHTFPI